MTAPRKGAHALVVLLLGTFVLAAAPRTARAQAIISGGIEGTVNGPDGRPMFGVTITVSNQTTGRRWIVRTDRGGRYGVGFLGVGRYDALFERIGYLPERVEGILVLAGERRLVSVGLVAAEGPVVQARVRAADAVLSLSGAAGPDRWLVGTAGTPTLPFDLSDLSAVTRTTSLSGQLQEIEGLPATLSTLVVDGVPSASRPRALDWRTRAAAFPLSALTYASLETNAPDVEYAGSAAGLLTGSLRGGAGATRLDAFADFGSDAISVGASDAAAFQTYRFGGTLGGSIVRDTAGFLLGFEYAKTETPYRSLWASDSAAASLESTGASRYDFDLASLARPSAESHERVTGFGRLDLRVGENNTLTVRGSATAMPTTAFYAPWTGRTPGTVSVEKATEVFASANLITRLREGSMFNDLTAGFELSRHERDVGTGDPASVEPPLTLAAAGGLGFGTGLARLSESSVWSFYARNTLHLQSQGHRLKFGLALQLPSYDMTLNYPNAATFAFSSASAWNAGTGYYAGTDAIVAAHDWGDSRVAFYAQDSWTPTPNLDVVAGTRISVISNVDSLKVRDEPRWYQLTGLSNRSIEKTNVEIEPRFGLTWRPGGGNVIVEGTVQVDAQPVHASTMAELFFRDGSYNVRRGFGSIPNWPIAPDTGVAPTRGPALTMLGPQFQGPRTSRAGGSITIDAGAGLAFSVSGSFRRSEFLPQRVDVNLVERPAANDQNGRPLFGTLRKEGSLLFADGDSNRRFPEFDAVCGLQATGISTYTGFTFTAERPLRDWLGVRASYTYSKTDDNWPSPYGEAESQLAPFPDSVNGVDWVDGRSDLDVPHRAAIGVEVRVPGQIGATLGALFRHQSGYPFTPGYRAGVDANGDGSASNDPAFVDNNVPGTAELVSQWGCLSTRVGGFAGRNACRGPSLQALDARLTVHLGTLDRVSANVVVDALNLLATDYIVPDRAVYLVDPVRDLTVSPNGRNVIVPLIANPNFGQALFRYTPERVVRLGLRVSF